MHPNFGDVPGWISGLGTFGAVSLALFEIYTDRKKTAKRERKSQASLVSVWQEPPVTISESGSQHPAVILNNSAEPVYEVVVSLVFIQGAGPRKGEDLIGDQYIAMHRAVLGILPPGKWQTIVRGYGLGMQLVPAFEIAFTDRAGNHWIRRTNGKLEEIAQNAIDYYTLGRPLPLLTPTHYDSSE